MLRVAAVLATAAVGVVAFALLRNDPTPDDRTISPSTGREEGDLRPGVAAPEAPDGVVGAPYRESSGPGVEVRGRIENAAGDGVPGASIELELRRGEISFLDPDVTQLLVADDTGAFAFRTPSGGAWGARLRARVPHHVSTPVEINIRPDRATEPAVIVAHSLDGTRLVRIVDGNARPIEGVDIRTRESDETVTTDSSGQARVRVSRSFGTLRAVISHREHAAVVRRIDAWRGEGPQDLEFVLSPGYGISGVVRDRAGRPVSDAVIRVVSWTRLRTSTDDQGRFVLNGLNPNRTTRLTVRHADFLPGIETLDPKRARVPIDVTLQRGVDVCGSVETRSGQRLVGALVTLGAEKIVGRSMRTTDASGEFCVGAPVRGKVMLRVTYPGFIPYVSEALAGDDTDPIVVRLAQGSQLGGRVIDESGRGIPGAFLDLYLEEPNDLDRWAQSDDSGNWLAEGLPRTVHVEVSRYGFLSQTKKDVPTGRRNFDVMLVRSGGVEGIVLDPAGQPVTRFRVAMTPTRHREGGTPVRTPSGWMLPGRLFEDEDGRFSSDRTPLQPHRRYRLEVSSAGFETAVVDPYVPTLQPRNDPITVRLRRGGGARGLVVDDRGRPVKGAVVARAAAFSGTAARLERGPRAETDAGGTWELSGLPLGASDLEIRHARFRPAKVSVFITAGGIGTVGDTILQAAGGLEIQVRVAVGAAMPATKVVITPARGGPPVEHEMRDTTLKIPWINAGSHRVALESSDPELDGLESAVDIVQGRSRRIIFHPVAPRCDLTGSVTIDGRPPANVVVQIVISKKNADGTLSRHGTQNTRRDGSFAFPNLAPGQWHIAAAFTHAGRRHSGSRTIALQPRHAPVTLALETN